MQKATEMRAFVSVEYRLIDALHFSFCEQITPEVELGEINKRRSRAKRPSKRSMGGQSERKDDETVQTQ